LKIAFLDSGVGGLTVATEFFKIMPDKEYIYYGDTLHLPYGPRPSQEVKEFSLEIIDFLLNEKGADIIVIACNTASAVALNLAKNKFQKPIYGTINSASKKAIKVTKNKKVGIIGTEGTVKSKAYQNAIIDNDPNISVYAEPCPKFVNFVEKGELSGQSVYNYAQSCLEPLKRAKVDTLILGCTHFPYLTDIIGDVMGQEVNLINPAFVLARTVKNNIEKIENEKEIVKKEKIDFMVSDIGNISKLFWNGKLIDKNLISLSEVNVFE